MKSPAIMLGQVQVGGADTIVQIVPIVVRKHLAQTYEPQYVLPDHKPFKVSHLRLMELAVNNVFINDLPEGMFAPVEGIYDLFLTAIDSSGIWSDAPEYLR